MTGSLSGPPPAAALLDARDVGGYLAARGLTGPDGLATVDSLSGGVSSAVFAVAADGTRLVVKQALPRLRVVDRWEADPARTVQEGLALQTLHALTPDEVPGCLHLDEQRYVLVMPHAPAGWTDWKSLLLAGDVDPGVGTRLGRLLATWHTATRTGLGSLPALLHDRTAFVQLRASPFYETVMERRPDLADLVGAQLDRMLARRECLVHGDFSPKNVLVGDGGLWVIDHEVAHVGDPAFDLAFLLCHLALKSVYRPATTGRYRACAAGFVDAYYRGRAGEAPELEHVLAHVGCLLLARVVGKSPVEYLDERQRALTSGIAEDVLRDVPTDVAGLWARLPRQPGGQT